MNDLLLMMLSTVGAIGSGSLVSEPRKLAIKITPRCLLWTGFLWCSALGHSNELSADYREREAERGAYCNDLGQ